ncbi:30S ribosomal protein S2 [Candidatus Woesebacteria bacterium]|nr:30S ribosomal protein S2 [Candidatus Woesebacteria bacterium]|tara:strand:- start:2563 stop:3297 length:735 start_codon:yes stop_codon:yes gene_type:complete
MSVNITLEELLEAGSHFGHQIKRWNPKMDSFIYGAREGVHIFDLAKTREMLVAACAALRDKAAEGGTILFVGTKRQAKDLVTQTAEKVGMPYMTSRWLGGMLTNFEQIGKSIKKLDEMKKKRAAGEYKGRTKKERLLIDREIASLERVFGGVANLGRLPDMLFIVDTHEEHTAVREAARLGIPVVGVVDTNADPTDVDYPIPANDDAVKSVSLILDAVEKAVEEGKKKSIKGTKGTKSIKEENE